MFKIRRLLRISLLIISAALLFPCLIGCLSSYSFASYKSKAEDALRKKKFSKARGLYAVIYKEEKPQQGESSDNSAWAFYRLGVIAEVFGDLRLATGYYWGDRIDEGFYQPYPQIDCYAQAGWRVLDEGLPPRTIDEILAFEAKGMPVTAAPTDRKKREIVVPSEAQRENISIPGAIRPRRTFNRSLTPPPPHAHGPFKVIY